MKKIMLVDDEKDQIYFIKTSFENLFGKEYSIIPAESGEKCFELLAESRTPTSYSARYHDAKDERMGGV